ncbi:uncharacterized protein G2W53_008447 [Senna tora]|uniref:Uncharacterized protein n=1 Tax=Senna tora TaxID=362788 RepID=A0A834X8D4_9FABA|nr:uncharacterized protein G2W53_008447 [Senna tora]
MKVIFDVGASIVLGGPFSAGFTACSLVLVFEDLSGFTACDGALSSLSMCLLEFCFE